MSNDAGGSEPGRPEAGQPPPGAGPPGSPPYPAGISPAPGYPPPEYPPPPGYPTPPGYGPPDWGAPPGPAALKPGVIPLRPLSLSDIFNGAVTYIRANPKATLGLTAIVVVASQLLALILQVGPLAAAGRLDPSLRGDEVSPAELFGSAASSIGSALALILLSGMLTVVIGRAVFGAAITVGEAWQRLRGRLLALIGFTLLETVALLLVAFVGVVVMVAMLAIGGLGMGLLVGLPLVLAVSAVAVYLWVILSFVPSLIVLERLGVLSAITRSFALVKNSFWRVLGIRMLAGLVALVIAAAVGVPFGIAGAVLETSAGTAVAAVVSLIVIALGNMVGQIITTPFTAGVVVLLYADRRIRAEAFDLVLQSGAAAGPTPADSTDQLWLTRHR